LWNEVTFARNRINGRIITEAVVLQSAMVPLAGGSAEHFKKLVEQIGNGR
jgi:hypothetical protein